MSACTLLSLHCQTRKLGSEKQRNFNNECVDPEDHLLMTYSQIKVRSLVHSESKSQITKSVHQNGP